MQKSLLTFYQQYKTIIISVAMILSCLVLVIFGIAPQLKALIENQKTFEEVTSKSQFLEVRAKELQTLEGSNLESKVDIVLYSLPAEKDYPSSLNVLQQVSLANNFKLTNVTISQSLGGTSKLTGFGIKAEATGPRTSLDNFIKSIDQAPKVMKVSSIEVSNPRGSDTIVVILGIDVFFAPVPSQLGSVDSKLPQLTDQDNELLNSLTRAVPTTTRSEGFIPSPKGKLNPFE